MKHLAYLLSTLLIGFTPFILQSQELSADEIIQKVDDNMTADTQILLSDMIIHGKRNSRTITSRIYSQGKTKSFSAGNQRLVRRACQRPGMYRYALR